MRYRSKFEADLAVALSNQGHPVNYEQHSFSYRMEHIYVPDFHLDSEHGPIYIEAKGTFTSKDRTKLLRVHADNPGIRLFVVLQRPYGRLNKKSQTTYAQWCNKFGIPWCPAPIPESFLQQWLSGSRPTFRARIKNAPVQMQLL